MSGYPVLKGILQSSHNYTWNTADSLGRGATAVVYLGREKGTGHVVAVKVFHEHLRIGQGGEDLRELELLRRLNHENIISLFAIEQETQTKRMVLVMEYCEGGSLYHMLDQAQFQYGLPEPQFLLVLYHVAAGMEYLRSAGVVHRDINPGNIMRYLTEDGSSVYKLTDFGAARDLNDDENFTSLYGTEEYLHPGMYQRAVLRQAGGQHFDAKVDLWSLGVTFYHVATGQLPFQPYGGRNNKETMYRIISEKESGVISGQQHFDGGPILWGRELPQTCLLSSGVRQMMTPLLAGLMEPDPASMLSYDAFFRSVRRLHTQVKLQVFNYVYASMLTLFIDPSSTMTGLQDRIAGATDLPATQQVLVVGGSTLEEVVDPLLPISRYPTHLVSAVIYLFPRDLTLSQHPPLSQREIPPFPEFLNIIDVDKDARLALNCLARGHLIKQHAEKVEALQRCLVEGHLYFRMYVESRLRRAGEALTLMQTVVNESRKRFETFYTMLQSVKGILEPLGPDASTYFRDSLKDETLRKVHSKAEERAEEIQRYSKGLQEKVDEARPQAALWLDMCEKSACTAKVEHHLSVISNIQNRFRRDKTVKNQMTSHDENIHRFERQKLQEHCMRMLSILTGHCVPTLGRLHKQAFTFVGLLIKALARIIKVEKNNESVVNCQLLLSSRLEKIESKCQEEVTLVRGKGLAGLPAPDEGVGASLSTTGSTTTTTQSVAGQPQGAHPEGVFMRPAGATSMEPTSSSSQKESLESMRSLRQDSEEILDVLEANMKFIKEFSEEAKQPISSGSLSLMMKQNKLS